MQEFEINDAGDDEEEYVKLIEILASRCRKFGITHRVETFMDSPDLYIEMPNGREKRTINVYGIESANEIQSIDFENYVFVSDFEAICNYKSDVLEFMFSPVGRIPRAVGYRRLFGIDINQDAVVEPVVIQEAADPRKKIEISGCSTALLLLSGQAGNGCL